eukprot:m.445089 g.445089  ORF g.445089 m.445089 type:complete len:515 (+) comp20300_c18_seq11:1845-3389(+)
MLGEGDGSLTAALEPGLSLPSLPPLSSLPPLPSLPSLLAFVSSSDVKTSSKASRGTCDENMAGSMPSPAPAPSSMTSSSSSSSLSPHTTPAASAALEQLAERLVKQVPELVSVPTVEEEFGLNEWTDVLSLARPCIYITPRDMTQLHALVVERVSLVAPTADDQLRDILKDFSSGPDAAETAGMSNGFIVPTVRDLGIDEERAVKPVRLELESKFAYDENDDSDMRALFAKTKHMVVDLLRQLKQRHTLQDVLVQAISGAEEAKHRRYAAQAVAQQQASSGYRVRAVSVVGASLVQLQRMARLQISTLVKNKFLDATTAHGAILHAIALDIRTQRMRREFRQREMQKLEQSKAALEAKEQQLLERQDYYQKYLQACIDAPKVVGSSAAKSKPKKGLTGRLFSRKSAQRQRHDTQSFGSHKYTGAKLRQKGVLEPADGTPESNYKNATFEISSQEAGQFNLKAKLTDGGVESMPVSLPDLLQLQCDGIDLSVHLAGCRINVTALILLINKKFFKQ